MDEIQLKHEASKKEKESLIIERDEMKRYASELVEKVKNEVVGKEFLIDKRMINTFLVQYCNPRSDLPTKTHMLNAMSKILNFTTDEKKAIGLIPTEAEDEPAASNA